MGGLSDQVFEQKTALKRAKMAIDKKGDFTPRPKMWVQREALSALACKLLHMPELGITFAMLLTSYVFVNYFWKFIFGNYFWKLFLEIYFGNLFRSLQN